MITLKLDYVLVTRIFIVQVLAVMRQDEVVASGVGEKSWDEAFSYVVNGG